MKVALMALIAICGTLTYVWGSRPVVVTTVSAPENVQGAVVERLPLQTYRNAYFTTELPGQYIVKNRSPGNGQTILLQELYTVAAPSPSRIDQLAITVGRVEDANLESISAVQMRLRTAVYQKASPEWLPRNWIAFERVDGTYELSVFALNDESLFVSIVVSGPMGERERLVREMQTTTTAFTWL